MIKNIVFDMGNVLVGWTPMEFALRAAGNEEDAKILYAALFDTREWGMADAGFLSREKLLRLALERTPGRLQETLRMLEADWPAWMRPIEGAEDFVRRCKAAGMGLYLLSNAGDQFPAVLENRPFYPLFDGFVVSAHEKLTKPDPRIYRRLCERYDLKPDECFFIDDIEANVLGAASIGMQGIVFDGDYMKAQKALEEMVRSPRIL